MKIFLALIFLGISTSHAADPDKAHDHQGIGTRFTTPVKTKLSSEDTATLKSGKPIMKQVKADGGGRGVAIMDIAADEKTVWSVITDFPSYPNWINQLSLCEVYKKEGSQIYTRFIINAALMKVEYFINHTYSPEKGYITWELDYSRQSDLDDSTGYWMVYPSPLDPAKTRVEYSVDLRIKDWVPKFVQNMLANQGVEDATKWVKKQSEKRAK
jgi:ribosome-associated toxin RatA of RatAB toxin-antitoxin module